MELENIYFSKYNNRDYVSSLNLLIELKEAGEKINGFKCCNTLLWVYRNPFKFNSNLEILVLNNCRLNDNDMYFLLANLKMLKHLNLVNNRIKTIPVEIKKMNNLIILNLSNNDINAVNKSIFPQNLEILNLSYNNINSIGNNVFPLSLKELDLSYNNISNLDYFLNDLIKLNLQNNNIKGDIEMDLDKNKLQLLDLSYNKITSFTINYTSDDDRPKSEKLNMNENNYISNICEINLTHNS